MNDARLFDLYEPNFEEVLANGTLVSFPGQVEGVVGQDGNLHLINDEELQPEENQKKTKQHLPI